MREAIDRRAPGCGWYFVGVLIIAAGVGVFAWLIAKTVLGMGGDMQRVVVPGRTELDFERTGRYTLFYEYRSAVAGRVFSTPETPPGLKCLLRSAKTGGHVPLDPAPGGTYESGSRAGLALFEFSIKNPGRYQLLAAYPEGEQGPDVVLAVAHEYGRSLGVSIGGGLAALFTSLMAGILCIVVTAYRRYRATGSL